MRDLYNSDLALEPADETGLAKALCSSRVDSHEIRGLCFLYAYRTFAVDNNYDTRLFTTLAATFFRMCTDY